MKGAPKTETRLPCPCLHTVPCNPRCTCVNGFSSSGCLRCCTYGSPEQQKRKAEILAAKIGGSGNGKTETRVEWAVKKNITYLVFTNEETARMASVNMPEWKLIRRTIKTEIVEEEIQ